MSTGSTLPPPHETGFRVDVHRQGDCVTVGLVGELDVSTEPLLEAAASQVFEPAPSVVRVDLRRLTFIDSTGSRRLAGWQRTGASLGVRMALVCSPGHTHVYRVLDFLGVIDLFEVLEDLPAGG